MSNLLTLQNGGKMVRKAEKQDIATVAGLAILMWDENSLEDLIAEFSEILSSGEAQFFLKYEADIPVGFAQCQLRHDYVEGTETSPVGYLEGIFVKEGFRHKGYARELLEECEKWAKENNVKYTYASSSSSSSAAAAPENIKASKTSDSVTLTWDKADGADMYKVYKYNGKTGKYEKYKDVKSAKCTVSGLSANTKYKFKVVSYSKNKDGKYVKGESSKAVSVTTKK